MIPGLLGGCDPYAGWPDAAFPEVYTEETGLPPFADVRVETETWVPLEDLAETALYVQKAVAHRPGAPREELLHFAELRPRLPPLARGDRRVTFGGDLMMFDGAPAGVLDGIADRLDGLRVANLETPTAPSFPTVADRDALAEAFGLYAFNMPPALLDGLPLDVIQLTNNHANDLGPDGLRETLTEVLARHYLPVGTAGNRLEVDVGGQPYVFRAYTWGINAHDPPPGRDLGIVPFGHEGPVDLGRAEAELAADREAGAAQVIAVVHWGYEYEYYPTPAFLALGRRLVAAGADLVVGTGPHVVQPAEICDVDLPGSRPGIGRCAVRTPLGRPRRAAILYSLGDLATDLPALPLSVGVLATVSFAGAGGVSGLRWDPIASILVAGERRVYPVDRLISGAEPPEGPLPDGDREALAAEAARLDQHLGTSWRRR